MFLSYLYSCSEISSFLALGSQSHFTEAFRKKNGITPKQFRDREYKHHISRKKTDHHYTNNGLFYTCSECFYLYILIYSA
ncbi:AraC family transcriptional regulator [Butyrivibrio sp. AE3006]|uniref:AraC family transcriptional regulator n=1 Tax=Butyrivibrio sp. AE3006 TaxID=1280673 RepID=UPI0018CA9875